MSDAPQTPFVKVDGELMAENWLAVDMYKAVFGHLPLPSDEQISEEEVARRFLKLWDQNPSDYSFSLYLLANKMLGRFSGSVVRNG